MTEHVSAELQRLQKLEQALITIAQNADEIGHSELCGEARVRLEECREKIAQLRNSRAENDRTR